MSGDAANPDIHGEPYRDACSPQIDLASRRSRDRAALDIAVVALREARRVTILAVSAACDLEDFRPEDTNVVRRIDRALDDIAALVPEAVP